MHGVNRCHCATVRYSAVETEQRQVMKQGYMLKERQGIVTFVIHKAVAYWKLLSWEYIRI